MMVFSFALGLEKEWGKKTPQTAGGRVCGVSSDESNESCGTDSAPQL
jgi:hypothetical protein